MDKRLFSGPRPFTLVLGAVALEIVGFIIALLYGADEFMRFGVWLIAFGVVFVSVHLFSIQNASSWLLPMWESSYNETLNYLRESHEAMVERHGPDADIVRLNAHELQKTESEFQSRIEKHKQDVDSVSEWLFLVEIGCIVVGTIQIGYGDRLFQWILIWSQN
jgi:hypothetical protein